MPDRAGLRASRDDKSYRFEKFWLAK